MNVGFDQKKAASNVMKHGVSFEEAATCLLDPLASVREDPDARGEQRLFLLRMCYEGRLLTVCYALCADETIRLISARKATKKEEKIMRKEYDFSRAKRAVDVPHLVKLQADSGGKTRITMRVDSGVLAAFKACAELSGGSYQTMMNEALKQFALELTLADVVRETIRGELHST